MELPPKTPQDALHQSVMREICFSVSDTPMVLKGGTALLLCYGLDRPSEDLDFDSSRKMGLERRITDALKGRCRIDDLKTLKDTDTVQRLRLNYSDLQTGLEGSLKIETSFRESPDPSQVVVKNGIRVYTLNKLFILKTIAFYERTTARDFYDLAFLLGNQSFSPDSSSLARLHADFSNPKRFAELEHQFRHVFEADPLLSSRDFDKVMISLSERIQQAHRQSHNPH
jgi:Uncharacterized conserved protein